MDKKLEARITRLEKILGSKSVKNEADDANAAAWAEFDKVVLDRLANEDVMDGMESNHEDGGMVFGDIKFAAEQLINSDLPEAKSLANDLARMADRVEKLYAKVKAKAEELRSKEEELRVNNGWTKTAVKARVRSLK